jgi:hypothetical protein
MLHSAAVTQLTLFAAVTIKLITAAADAAAALVICPTVTHTQISADCEIPNSLRSEQQVNQFHKKKKLFWHVHGNLHPNERNK